MVSDDFRRFMEAADANEPNSAGARYRRLQAAYLRAETLFANDPQEREAEGMLALLDPTDSNTANYRRLVEARRAAKQAQSGVVVTQLRPRAPQMATDLATLKAQPAMPRQPNSLSAELAALKTPPVDDPVRMAKLQELQRAAGRAMRAYHSDDDGDPDEPSYRARHMQRGRGWSQ